MTTTLGVVLCCNRCGARCPIEMPVDLDDVQGHLVLDTHRQALVDGWSAAHYEPYLEVP